MLRLIKATAVTGILAVALTLPVAAQASPREGVRIDTIRQGPSGVFESSGEIVDSGTFTVRKAVFGGPGPGNFVIVHATETFSGTAGTFTVTRTVRVTWGSDPSVRSIDGNWVVIAGTGAYDDLHGQGRISGTVQGFPPAEVFALTYAGSASND